MTDDVNLINPPQYLSYLVYAKDALVTPYWATAAVQVKELDPNDSIPISQNSKFERNLLE